MARYSRPAGEIVPSYGWFGDPKQPSSMQYTPVWQVIVNGHQVGLWTKARWARRDLRWHLRRMRRGA